MKKLLTLAAMFAALTVAQAQNYTASLDGAQAGGGARTGTGTATLFVHDGLLLDYMVMYSGLSGAVNNQHIHGPAAPGVSAGVIVPFNAPVAGMISGANVPITQLTLDRMNAGLTYVNIHSTTFPSGEIRGQIYLVPEPATAAVLGLGLAALVVARRRK